MKTGLKKSQKTTEIFFDEASPIIMVSTYNTDLKNRLSAYSEKHPDLCKLVDDSEDGRLMFEIEKGRFCFRLTEPYSKERRSAASEFAKKQNHMLTEQKYLQTELQRCLSRQEKVASLYEKLYEDNASGKVTDEWFMHMSRKYEVERVELKVRISKLHDNIVLLKNKEQDKETFVSAIRKFMRMETITAPLLHELIDHIDVYETEGTGKNKTQRIVIYYRFVGYIELPIQEEELFSNDTRQGVAVTYIPKALPESITA